MDVLLRLGVALALLSLVLLGARLACWAFAVQTRRTVARLNRASLSSSTGARILYFTSARCMQCRTHQEPALRSLVAAAPEPVHIDTFDAARDRAVASRYRILTAPSTVVITGDGRVAAINHGFVPAERLAAQLGWPAPSAS